MFFPTVKEEGKMMVKGTEMEWHKNSRGVFVLNGHKVKAGKTLDELKANAEAFDFEAEAAEKEAARKAEKEAAAAFMAEIKARREA